MNTHRTQPDWNAVQTAAQNNVQSIVAGVFRLGLLLAVCVVFALPARADVIVLKSGRRIQAGSVVERDGKVYYETDLGSFAIPARLVVGTE